MRAVKILLMGFVFAGVYKTAAVHNRSTLMPVVPAETVQPAVGPGPAVKEVVKKPGKPAAEAKTAVVYYFYTNTRCSSCKAIETYTKEAVARNFTGAYKGWAVVFKGVNVEEEPDKHFVQDYWLNSKSVVVQKFAGEKPLKWGKLEKVWQLLGDKEAFINYITDETHKLLDEK